MLANEFDVKLTGDDFINLRSRLDNPNRFSSSNRSGKKQSRSRSPDLAHSVANAVQVALKKRQMQIEVSYDFKLT